MSTTCNDKCAETVGGTLERPRYSPGLILQDTDLTAAVDYTRNLNRLLFRSLFGCGVICGLEVSVIKDECGMKVFVAPGVALDASGNAIEVTRKMSMALDKCKIDLASTGTAEVKNLWVLLRNKEKSCAPRGVVCDVDEEDMPTQTTRVQSCAEVTIVADLPKCMCGYSSNFPDLSDSHAAVLIGNKELTLPQTEKCEAGCGCGGDCGCGDPVLLAWVHKFENGKWGPIHRGIRRFIRPTLLPDPIKDKAP
ncbi:hypothetical protein [Bradyrhizobium sp. 2S1]|uniref:hypothetical protein n=1 Tax=Bradyrhizobium sp. 2S1 TaxID=1404429 RepID=UPI00140C11E0|nr:hypothetical protein [Bradyrhizobium sp. 2S1]MCK7665029.1 hypothetical protein [Bradyrhizobium sp. 2S1]